MLQQVHPSTSQSQVVEEEPPAGEAMKVYFSCPEDGCITTYQSYGNLQKHLDAGKHLLRLEIETTYDTIKKKWADTCAESHVVNYGKKQDQALKMLLTIQFVRSPKDGRCKHGGEQSASRTK